MLSLVKEGLVELFFQKEMGSFLKKTARRASVGSADPKNLRKLPLLALFCLTSLFFLA